MTHPLSLFGRSMEDKATMLWSRVIRIRQLPWREDTADRRLMTIGPPTEADTTLNLREPPDLARQWPPHDTILIWTLSKRCGPSR